MNAAKPPDRVTRTVPGSTFGVTVISLTGAVQAAVHVATPHSPSTGSPFSDWKARQVWSDWGP